MSWGLSSLGQFLLERVDPHVSLETKRLSALNRHGSPRQISRRRKICIEVRATHSDPHAPTCRVWGRPFLTPSIIHVVLKSQNWRLSHLRWWWHDGYMIQHYSHHYSFNFLYSLNIYVGSVYTWSRHFKIGSFLYNVVKYRKYCVFWYYYQ